VSCAWSGPCGAYAKACLNNPECVAIMTCYETCDKDCLVNCWLPHPKGQADHNAVSICIYCDNCFNDCNSSQYGCP